MARAGESRLRFSGLRASADDLGRGQKLRAAAGQRAALASALPENLLTRSSDRRASSRREQLVEQCPLFPPKADITIRYRHVRYVPKADIVRCDEIRRYSITSSARASKDWGTDKPSAFAVFRLMASSYLFGACTGRSAGFSPRNMRST